MENKKTAVEWLIDMLVTENEVSLKGENYKLFEQAKQMEKEQIIDSFGVGAHYKSTSLIGYHSMAEQYYNETYGK
jgi:hypothetical protein